MGGMRFGLAAALAALVFVVFGATGRAGAPAPGSSDNFYPLNDGAVFHTHCASCHEPAIGRAPTRAQLRGRSPEDLYDALTNGVMRPVTRGMSQAELYAAIHFITGRAPTPNATLEPIVNPCRTDGPLQPDGPRWNGWGNGIENNRYQPNPGFSAAAIPRLKVKWAFSYVGTHNTEPLIFGDRLFVASMGGEVYSLGSANGCVHWRTALAGGARASMSIGALASAPSGYALYVAGDRRVVEALDAGSGRLLWSAKVDDHPMSRLTGSPTLYDGVLYVPISSSEETAGYLAGYGCCTFIGAVVALDAASGKQIWRQAVLDAPSRPTRKNAAGVQMYGPAGGSVWSAPTVDAARGRLYIATGESYTEVAHPTSDAVIALDLKTGRFIWIHQVRAADNFVLGTFNQPDPKGLDYDLSTSPNLIRLVDGRDILVTASKSSIVYAMDPATGAGLWHAKLGAGGPEGGVMWGTASDGVRLFTPLNETGPVGRPGLVAQDPASGRALWGVNAAKTPSCHIPSGRCAIGFGQAVTAVPGAVFAGVRDGWLRAYAAADGGLLWAYDATRPVDTVNGVKAARGGSFNMGGPTVAGGMMFVHAGYDGDAGPNDLLLAFSVDGR
jgi:polyvinyl alcohol dehydrogenase (cytochrome)